MKSCCGVSGTDRYPLGCLRPQPSTAVGEYSEGEHLLQRSALRLLGRTAHEVGLQNCLSVGTNSCFLFTFSNPHAHWLIRRSSFSPKGSTLYLGRSFRHQAGSAGRGDETFGSALSERSATSLTTRWRRSSQLQEASIPRIPETALNTEDRQEFTRGPEIIETRADSLNCFLQTHHQLTQMPPSLTPSLPGAHFAAAACSDGTSTFVEFGITLERANMQARVPKKSRPHKKSRQEGR